MQDKMTFPTRRTSRLMPRPRLAFHNWPAAVYAIGDVHGCLEQLLALERTIAADGSGLDGEKWIVTLGDYIDRGPDSAGVVEHLLEPPPPGFRRIALIGNHEQVMLDFIAEPAENAYWLEEGGLETLRSYGVDLDARYPEAVLERALATDLDRRIPAPHRVFLDGLPVLLSLPGWLFVHAGIRPGVPLLDQSDEDLIWIRTPFLSAQLTGGLRIVHGHTPASEPVVTPHRIDIDTHCFSSGRLSAVRVTPDGKTKFFSADGPPAAGY